MEPLTSEQIEALLQPESEVHNAPKQVGPLRYFEPPWKPCTSTGCRVPTPYKVAGQRRCTIHALRDLNQMLVERGVDGS